MEVWVTEAKKVVAASNGRLNLAEAVLLIAAAKKAADLAEAVKK